MSKEYLVTVYDAGGLAKHKKPSKLGEFFIEAGSRPDAISCGHLLASRKYGDFKRVIDVRCIIDLSEKA